MRLVIDLQACQNAGSRFRGIGRYSRSLAMAMAQEARGHEVWVALNADLGDAIEDIRACLGPFLPQERIVVWQRPFDWSSHLPGDPWRGRINEVVREDFLAALKPDLVHLASLFEGWGDAATTSIGRGSAPAPATAVTLYDLIPMAMSEQYLQDPRSRQWYARKIEDLRRARLCLAISDHTRQEAIRLLDLPPERVVNISGSIDPMFRRLPPDPARSAALARRVGVARPFVMYTGGFDPRKNVDGLIRAFAALPPTLREGRQLLVVGTPPPGQLPVLQSVAQASGLQAEDVVFAGFIPDAELVRLYNDCELYVFPSRSEGFGLPALEAMACGAPVIGADASSLPEVIGYAEAMFDPASDAAMSQRMQEALTDEAFRTRLRAHGEERVGTFSWQHSAQLAWDALEACVPAAPAVAAKPADASAEDARWDAIGRQSERLSLLARGRVLAPGEARRIAAAQSWNHPRPWRRRQLLVDVSNLSERDARTGIQRVVAHLLRGLIDTAPAELEVAPVRFEDGVLRYARGFLHRLLGHAGVAPGDDLADPAPGDVFLGLDLSAHIIPHNMEPFERLRRAGVAMHFVVYDLIPWLRPDSVNPDALQLLWAWYRSIGVLADGLCCISAAVEQELVDWCDEVRPARQRPLHLGHFHLGSDQVQVSARSGAVLPASRRQRFLMVGTIEPRKGHRQALDAFERLWAQGTDVELVIVGKPGWLMEDFVARLLAHPELNQRLHWPRAVDDGALAWLYRDCAALLAASEEEGFGLPIAEAAAHGLPVIARDLPVFREVAGGHAFYFSGHGADELATAITRWCALAARGEAPDSRAMPRLDWNQSARQLLDLVLAGRWTHTWCEGPRHWFPARDQRLQRQVGVHDRKDLVTDERAGFLTYGPYVRLQGGRYRLEVQGQWTAPACGAATLEIVAQQGQAVLLAQPLSPEDGFAADCLYSGTIDLSEDFSDVEFRLFVAADSALRLSGIELLREEPAQ